VIDFSLIRGHFDYLIKKGYSFTDFKMNISNSPFVSFTMQNFENAMKDFRKKHGVSKFSKYDDTYCYDFYQILEKYKSKRKNDAE